MADATQQAVGADMPVLPGLSKIKSSGQALGVMEQGLQRQAELLPQINKAQADVERAQAKAEKDAEEARYQEFKKYRAEEDKNALELRQKMLPNPEFHPTEENAQSLASLFSLVATAGMLVGSSGKLSAQRAMDSMTGMLKGWQQGRADQFKQAKDTFDRELARVKSTNDAIMAELKEAREKYATDREAAMHHMEMATRIAGSNSVIGAKAKLGDIQGAYSLGESGQRTISEIYKTLAKAEQDAYDRQYARETARIVARERAAASGAKQSVLLSGRAENIREAFVQAAADVENISKFPPKTVLGTFSGMTGQEGATLTNSLANTFARKITNTESRMLQQLVSGLETNLANALGGGYAASASKTRIDQYKSQIPKAGDNGYVAADFLARIKQEMNLLAQNFPSKPGATPQMSEAVEASNAKINAAVPFTVDDVLTAYYAKEKPPVSPNAESKSEAPELTEEQYNAAPAGTRYRIPGSKKVLVKQ
jgi:hypothetical protein